jgi:peptidoglycan-associated lipoprotein
MKISNIWIKSGILIFTMLFLFAIGCAQKKSLNEGIAEEEMSSKGGAISTERISEEEITGQQKAAKDEMLKKTAMQKFVNEDVYFDFDDASIRPDAREILNYKVEWLKANSSVSVTIEGHCDERGTEAYNIALGERRAQNIKSFLITNGIDNSRLDTISYGKEKPLDQSHNETAWAKNRRGHFHIDKSM